MSFLPNIERFRKRASDLESELSNPAVYSDQKRASELARELQRLKKLLADCDRWQSLQKQIVDNEQLAAGGDPEMAELAKAELETLRKELEKVSRDIQLGLVPRDPNDSRNKIGRASCRERV